MLDIDPGSEEASGGCRPGGRGGRGRPGAALGVSFATSFSGGARRCLWFCDLYRLFRTGSSPLFFRLFYFYLFFPSFLAGRLTGEEVPWFDSQVSWGRVRVD